MPQAGAWDSPNGAQAGQTASTKELLFEWEQGHMLKLKVLRGRVNCAYLALTGECTGALPGARRICTFYHDCARAEQLDTWATVAFLQVAQSKWLHVVCNSKNSSTM